PSPTPHHPLSLHDALPICTNAAYHLARRGARVKLFDATHPREKPCGGGVTGRALALVSRAVEVPKLPASIITHARFSSSHSKQRSEEHTSELQSRFDIVCR